MGDGDTNWLDALWASVLKVWARVEDFGLQILAAFLIVVVGYVIALIARRVITALLRRVGFDRASQRAGLDETLNLMKVKLTPSEILGRVFFWFIFFFALLSAADTLGLEQVSRSIDLVIGYLPNLFGAIVLLVLGLAGARLASRIFGAFTARLYGKPFDALVKAVHGLLVVVVVGLALSQLQVETALFEMVFGIALGCAGLGLALAIGLGSKGLASNVLSGIYNRDSFRPGVDVKIGEVAGKVIEVGTVSTLVATETGEVRVPNATLTESVVEFSSPKGP